jgi:hypothetical protein
VNFTYWLRMWLIYWKWNGLELELLQHTWRKHQYTILGSFLMFVQFMVRSQFN